MAVNKEFLDDLCKDNCCGGGGYCILKEVISHDSKYNERLLCQIGCVNKFKYEESEKWGYDIGWSRAWLLFVEYGMAKIFSDVYNEGDKIGDVYKKIVDSLKEKY